jgi:hypothetical protein
LVKFAFSSFKRWKKHLQTNTEATSRRDNPEIIGPKHGDTEITQKETIEITRTKQIDRIEHKRDKKIKH